MLAEFFQDLTLGKILFVLFIIYMLIIKAQLGANATPKDYEQEKRKDAERAQQAKQADSVQQQTVEQTTTTTTTTTTQLGNWGSLDSKSGNVEGDSRVNYSDPMTSQENTNNTLDAENEVKQ